MSLERQRPKVSAERAMEIAEALYGLTGSVRSLPSERDQNFHLTTAIGTSFVLKISGADEPEAHLELQNAALAWMAERSAQVKIPQVARTLTGDRMTTVEVADGRHHRVRLFTYLPGIPLADARPRSPALFHDVGRQLAELDVALEGFDHPSAHRTFVWNLDRAPAIIDEHLDALDGARERASVERVLEIWEEMVAPRLGELRRSVVHNDANDYNVLVAASGAEPRTVTGFVDFGDLVAGLTVADPAIAVAYAMLGTSNPLAAARQVVKGYHATFPLSEAEIEVLFPLALARLAVSVAVAARRRHEEPANDYLVISERPAWAALDTLLATQPRFARAMLREACGLEPSVTSPAVVAWLTEHRDNCSPVIDPDPRSVTTTVLDLGVGSAEFPSAEELAGTKAFSDLVFAAMGARKAKIGIGRYDEARFVYTSAAFAGPDNELPERRTVHLGVDLFAKPKTPVRAPLDGRVHSVRDNAQPLDYGPTVVLEHAPTDGPVFYTLYGHLGKECLDRLTPGMPVGAGEQFAEVGSFRVNGNWPPHLHVQIVTDLLGRDGEFPGVAAPSEREVWLSLCPNPNLVLGLGDEVRAARTIDRATILGTRRQRLGPNLSVSYREPLHIVRGRGQFLYDDVGRAYLDCVNNVCHVGHCHPHVVRAAQEQVAVLNTNTRYLHEHIVRYAERLTAMLPAPLEVCYFVCSGSEANELALRLARTHTGAQDLVVLEGGYHGNTQALIEASSYKFRGPGGRGAPEHVHAVVMPDDYRGPYRRDDADCGTKYADHVRAALAEAKRQGRAIAAFFSETLLGCGGQIELPPGYLAEAYRHARDAGAVCIADEVQVGFGRVGTHFWGFETQDVVPDIVTLGKPIGNGHPLAAVITTREIARSFDTGMEYFNTFGGNPVSCAIGLAVLDVIEREGLQDHALRAGSRLREGLLGLMTSHAIVGDVRGRGLFLGIELVRDREQRTPAAAEADYVVQRAREHGVLLSTDGPDHNVIKIKPPMVFGEKDADRVLQVVDAVLAEDFVVRP